MNDDVSKIVIKEVTKGLLATLGLSSEKKVLPIIINSIDENDFKIYRKISKRLLNFKEKLITDRGFYQNINSKFKVSDLQKTVKNLLIGDLVNCTRKFSDVHNHNTREYCLLSICVYSLITSSDLDYNKSETIFQEDMKTSLKNVFSDIIEQSEKYEKEPNHFSFLSQYIKDYNDELFNEYSQLLYDYSFLICNFDNTISKYELEVLEEIKTSKLNIENINTNDKDSNKNNQNVLTEIKDLIGLHSVKKEIQSLINLIKIQNARKKEGLKTNSFNYHLVFTGNPGTGKTTVARIVSKIYKELGILKKGQLIETDRSGLIAEYVGQTAIKVNKLVDSALDGVLFIDEAYSITDGEGNDFGKEAISTLLKRMEDERERLVVIVAGYSNKMNDFLESNPGLSSRFNRYIDFEDYSQEDLINIFQKFVETNQYELTESAKKTLDILFKKAIENKDENFGNGRFVRNTFEKTIEKQSNRIANIEELNEEILKKIEQEDIP